MQGWLLGCFSLLCRCSAAFCGCAAAGVGTGVAAGAGAGAGRGSPQRRPLLALLSHRGWSIANAERRRWLKHRASAP